MSEYNGWSNYETWLVNLHFDELFYEYAAENPMINSYELSQLFSSVVNEITFEAIPDDNYFINDMANAFLSAVNYVELAEAQQS